MLNNNIEEMLKGLTEGEIATLIGLAYREKQNRDEAKEEKYMSAIRTAIQEYLENVGELSFIFDYEDKDDREATASISVNKLAPPACDNGSIYVSKEEIS